MLFSKKLLCAIWIRGYWHGKKNCLRGSWNTFMFNKGYHVLSAWENWKVSPPNWGGKLAIGFNKFLETICRLPGICKNHGHQWWSSSQTCLGRIWMSFLDVATRPCLMWLRAARFSPSLTRILCSRGAAPCHHATGSKQRETNPFRVKWMQVSFASGGIWWFGVSRNLLRQSQDFVIYVVSITNWTHWYYCITVVLTPRVTYFRGLHGVVCSGVWGLWAIESFVTKWSAGWFGLGKFGRWGRHNGNSAQAAAELQCHPRLE